MGTSQTPSMKPCGAVGPGYFVLGHFQAQDFDPTGVVHVHASGLKTSILRPIIGSKKLCNHEFNYAQDP